MHNEVTHVFAHFCKQAGLKNIMLEPALEPLSGEKFSYKTTNVEDSARADLAVTGLWTCLRKAFFDTMVVHPQASSYNNKSIPAILKLAEQKKKREYQRRINLVENSDFSPLVFTTNGAMGSQAIFVVKRLCELLATKSNHNLSLVTGHFRCRLSFALLRSSLICLRGSRPIKRNAVECDFDYSIHRLMFENESILILVSF